MKYLFLVLCIFSVFSCNDSAKTSGASLADTSETNTDSAVIINMEGQTYTMQASDIVPQNLNFEKDSLLYSIYTNDSPVSINFNLTNTDILKKAKAEYKIPETNAGPVLVDLSFFNKDRQSSRMNKRIIFRKGNINIEKITQTSLKMSFDGEGGGMMDSKNSFPISGTVNINY